MLFGILAHRLELGDELAPLTDTNFISLFFSIES